MRQQVWTDKPDAQNLDRVIRFVGNTGLNFTHYGHQPGPFEHLQTALLALKSSPFPKRLNATETRFLELLITAYIQECKYVIKWRRSSPTDRMEMDFTPVRDAFEHLKEILCNYFAASVTGQPTQPHA